MKAEKIRHILSCLFLTNVSYQKVIFHTRGGLRDFQHLVQLCDNPSLSTRFKSRHILKALIHSLDKFVVRSLTTPFERVRWIGARRSYCQLVLLAGFGVSDNKLERVLTFSNLFDELYKDVLLV